MFRAVLTAALLLPCAAILLAADGVSRQVQSARLFEAHVAPILARHCFECHDSTSREGRLDLSQKASALAGRKGGHTIVPGNAAESLLWQVVERNEMPEDRPPLSDQDKKHLRDWIDSGAVWAAEQIDPLAFTRDQRAAYNWMRRLTVPEYIETVRAATGVNIAAEAQRHLPPDVRADGFRNTAYNLSADLHHVEAYARLAEIIVRKLDIKKFVARFTDCDQPTDACLGAAISGTGKWLFRSPLANGEKAPFMRLSRLVIDDGGDFNEAMRYVIEAMLQSPRFLYRIEKQIGDGKPRPALPYELSSRLSYIIWGGPPDEELVHLAENGEIVKTTQLQKQVARMLADDRAKMKSAQFIEEWLDLDRLSSLRPDPKHFPKWQQALAADMRRETIAFFEQIAWEEKRPLADLLNAPVTFATPRLAEFYGLPGQDLRARVKPSAANGMRLLYRFDDGEGDMVRDASKGNAPIHLRIAKPSATHWSKGGLEIKEPTILTMEEGSSTALLDRLKLSRAISIEVWLTPANASQKGPARVVTFSSGPSQRNFTLGQDGDKFEVRLRTSSTDANGQPAINSQAKSARKALTHIVYSRDRAGKARIYIDGEQQNERDITGDFSN
jgi:hypothetical protein